MQRLRALLEIPDDKLTRATTFFAAATLSLALIMLFTFPMQAALSKGFKTPIIAFEFAKTEADLAFMTGNGELEQSNRQQMDAGHRWDMLFPFAYAGLIALLLLQRKQLPRFLIYGGIVISLLIILFDLNENRVLLSITNTLESGDSTVALLADLKVATWLKWGAIGISTAILGAGYLADKQYVFAMLSLATTLAIIICGLSDANPTITEVMSLVTTLFFLAVSVHAICQSWRLRGTRL